MQYRILLTTGGTCGHIYPALAVAEQLRNKAELLFVGSQYGPETYLVKEADIPFYGLPVKGILGRRWNALSALCNMGHAIMKAKKLIQKFKPDIVVGFGSYASFAPLVAAKLKRIPIIIHEQNARAGLSNRVASKLADKICISMPDVAQVFVPHKTVYTGNPVRQSILTVQPNAEKESNIHTKHLLVMGGSLGAKSINSIVINGLDRLLINNINVLHQTGSSDWERVASAYGTYDRNRMSITPFIENMREAYHWADLVICRAGASSIAELASIGKPSILIPFPYATHDHQTANAFFLANAGASVLISEKDIQTTDVIGKVISLFNNRKALEEMSLAATKCGHREAAIAVSNEIFSILSGKD